MVTLPDKPPVPRVAAIKTLRDSDLHCAGWRCQIVTYARRKEVEPGCACRRACEAAELRVAERRRIELEDMEPWEREALIQVSNL